MGNKIANLSLIVCLGWMPAFSETTASNILLAALTDNLLQCGDTVCREETELCRDNSYCECKPHFEDQGSQKCVPCPGEGQLCLGCCISDALTCYRGVCQRCAVDSSGNCISQESLFFLTAAQVALATAMVLGVVSLSFLLYKTLRTRLRRNNQVLQSELRQSVASRVSLSSIQQRVVRRLRDRPPKYETRHNYEYQQRQSEGQNSQQTAQDIRQGTVPVPIHGPPPAYEGDAASLAENPPPYTQAGETSDRIAVIDIASPNSCTHSRPSDVMNNCDPSNVQGIANNQVFKPDKTDPTTQAVRSPSNGESNGRPKECIDTPLVSSSDKTVYI